MTFQSGLVRSYQITSIRNRAIKGSWKEERCLQAITVKASLLCSSMRSNMTTRTHPLHSQNCAGLPDKQHFKYTYNDTQLGNRDGMSWNSNKCCPHSLKDIKVTRCCENNSIILQCTCLRVKKQILLFISFCSFPSPLGEELLFDKFLFLTIGWRLCILHHRAVARCIHSTERSTQTRKVLLSQ